MLDEKAQHVFDELSGMLLANRPDLAKEMVMFAWEHGLSADDLCEAYPNAARRAREIDGERLVGG